MILQTTETGEKNTLIVWAGDEDEDRLVQGPKNRGRWREEEIKNGGKYQPQIVKKKEDKYVFLFY